MDRGTVEHVRPMLENPTPMVGGAWGRTQLLGHAPGVITVLGRRRRPFRRSPCQASPQSGREVLGEYGHRPSVDGHVVRDQQQPKTSATACREQFRAPWQFGCEVERP